jgi:hypothetical protein
MVTTFLDHALYIAKTLNVPVFPLIQGGKLPAIGGWQQRATTDEAEIRALWTEHDPVFNVTRVKPYNIGIYTKDRLVLDVDNKKGKNGSKALEDLCVLNDLPDTFTVRTPTGGFHYYFKPSASVGNSNSKLGLGLDVRGDDGLAVGPGSRIVDEVDGRKVERFYEIINDAPIADAPAWLEQLAGRPRERSADAGKPATMPNGEPLELDTPYARQRAVDWLKGIDPNKRPSTYTAACECKDYGLSALGTLEIMAEHWNGPIHPGMDFEVLAQKVDNAYRYGKRPIGAKSPSADFDEVPAGPVDTAETPTQKPPAAEPFEIVGYGDPIDRPEPEPLIDGILDKGAAVLLYGAPKTGKSFVLFEMGRSVACGKKFADKYTERGAVVIFCFEGHAGLSRRRKAMRRHHGDKDLPLFIVKAKGSILEKQTQAAMAATVDAIEARCGQRIVLVGVDTVTAAAPGADQYAPGPAGSIVNAAKAISTAHGRTLILVHHAPKNGGDSPLGSVAFQGSVDAVLKVENKKGTRTLDGEMMREYAAGKPIRFELRTVDIGTTSRGVPVSSAVALFGAEADFTTATALTPREAEVEEVVLELAETCVPGGDDAHADIRLAQKDVEDALVRRWGAPKDENVRIGAETKARNAIGRWAKKRAQSHDVRVEKHGRANFLCFHPMAFTRTNAHKRAH